ncbi:MAG TPA: class I SAM-dependent methyltransferase [Candidatus Competibacteraceae bacterium]|nr:class I SAM-dependent methyltransferase [Candidatus Competibacteraceae bacterium]
MKIHRNLVEQLVQALLAVFAQGRHADKVIEQALAANPRWGARDRRQFAEGCYEIVRHWRRLWHAAGLPPGEYLVPAAVSAERLWRVWGTWRRAQGHSLPDWPELAGLVDAPSSPLPRALAESIPDWLDELGSRAFGPDWPGLLTALNRPAEVFLRVNTLKTERERLLQALTAEGIAAMPVAGLPDALRLTERRNVFQSAAFRQGLFEVQDAASQLVAPFLQVEPGQRVIDACAGAGGKTLHLAALMHNRGRIIALDLHHWKLQELRRRARRNGAGIIETRVIESNKTFKRLRDSADRLLLDVPCSGLGVLRRNPDKKWKLSPDEIGRLVELQRDILARYSAMTRPGGLLVYATCSLLPAENQEQVRGFLAQHPGQWELEEERTLRPDREGWDGFYMARLRRRA